MFGKNEDHKLGLYTLISMCIGSMIGAGLFALPQNIADSTGVVALFVAWIITFFGMICLAKVFQKLSMRCPDLDAGIYSYAKEGFGDYFGFSSAWGYWISIWLGNVGYVIILCASMSFFYPLLGDGTSQASLILNSIIIWAVTYLCIRGVKSAAMVNVITTIAKTVPIIVFIVIAAYAFEPQTFVTDIWQTASLGSIGSQVKNMMLITVWVFVGIEGASVFSARARNRRDVGRATIISFFIMFFILFAISVLPFGILSQAKLAALKEPAIGELLSHVVGGSWGKIFMIIALIISILGAFLSWILIAAEVPFIAGKKDGLFPQIFTRENKVHSPVGALIITAICQQLYLIVAYFYHSGYLVTVKLAIAMLLFPYLFSALYALLLVVSEKTYEGSSAAERFKDRLIGGVAAIYGIWLLYAAGKYLLLSSILYSLGSIVFIVNKMRRKQKVFQNKYELFLCVMLGFSGVMCVIALVAGKITL